PRKQNLVYYAEPTGGSGSGALAELDTSKTYNNVRRWFFSDLDPSETLRDPRQVIFDNDGRLWCVTGSGHLVSLDPQSTQNTRMSKHSLKEAFSNDLFGVAPDGGVIGYTAAAADLSKVAMLLPKRNEVIVPPRPATVVQMTFTAPATYFDAIQRDGQAPPVAKRMTVKNDTTVEGDRVVEALTDTATSEK